MVSHDLLLFMLKKWNLDGRNKLHAIPRFPSGSFAVHIGDHLRFGIICGPIWGSFPVWGSFAALHSPFVHTVAPEQQNILIKNSHMLYVSMGNRGLQGKTMDGKERRLGMGEATMVLLCEVAWTFCACGFLTIEVRRNVLSSYALWSEKRKKFHECFQRPFFSKRN